MFHKEGQSMSNCSRCGAELKGKKRFCVNCGQIQHKPPFADTVITVFGCILVGMLFLVLLSGK
jgi:predicted amidophosphoribosyltransferase